MADASTRYFTSLRLSTMTFGRYQRKLLHRVVRGAPIVLALVAEWLEALFSVCSICRSRVASPSFHYSPPNLNFQGGGKQLHARSKEDEHY